MIHQKQPDEWSSVGRKREPESTESGTCPECQGQITQHSAQGETACESCGLVLDDCQLDHGPEWRAFTSDERENGV